MTAKTGKPRETPMGKLRARAEAAWPGTGELFVDIHRCLMTGSGSSSQKGVAAAQLGAAISDAQGRPLHLAGLARMVERRRPTCDGPKAERYRKARAAVDKLRELAAAPMTPRERGEAKVAAKQAELAASIPPPPEGWDGEWNVERLNLACKARGIHTGADLARAINEAREARGERGNCSSNVCQRWKREGNLGARDPRRPAAGQVPACFEIALVLGVSLDWLTTPGAP